MAILLRCFDVRLAARALPPLDAPSLDNATAAGFFTRSGGCSNGVPFQLSPIALSMIDLAKRIGSSSCLRRVLLARVGMIRLWHVAKSANYEDHYGSYKKKRREYKHDSD